MLKTEFWAPGLSFLALMALKVVGNLSLETGIRISSINCGSSWNRARGTQNFVAPVCPHWINFTLCSNWELTKSFLDPEKGTTGLRCALSLFLQKEMSCRLRKRRDSQGSEQRSQRERDAPAALFPALMYREARAGAGSYARNADFPYVTRRFT